MSEQKKPAKITVNGKEYNIADLSDSAKEQLQSAIFAQNEVKHLQGQLAIAKTAVNAYQQALAAALPSE